MNKAFLLVALLPFAFTLAEDQPGKPSDQPGKPQFKWIDKKGIPLEYLAHTFFFHTASPEMLEGIISEEGINRLKPELAEHHRDVTDLRKIAPKLRRMCSDLQKAKSGQEFAAVFIEAEEADQNEKQRAARRILSKLDVDDRKALERYLDTEYRQGSHRGRLDYEAMFASGPFPSPESNLHMQRTCDSALQVEVRVVELTPVTQSTTTQLLRLVTPMGRTTPVPTLGRQLVRRKSRFMTRCM